MRYYPTAAHGKGGRDDGFVPAEEYDELSKLCDKLLTQQEQLQEEVRKQKQMLQVRVLWLQTCVTS
jgi:CHASE3 domain sensor protein